MESEKVPPLSMSILMKLFNEMKKTLSTIYNKFINQPIYLFWLLVIVNLVPSLELIMTEPLNFSGKCILILLPLAFSLMYYSISKRIGLLGLISFPVMFFHAFQIVVYDLFGSGVLAADMFLNVMTTSVSEANEVLNGILLAVIFVVLLYLPVTIFSIIAIRKKKFIASKFRIKTFLSGVFFLAVCIVLAYTSALNIDRKNYYFYRDAYPINVYYNLGFAVDRWNLSMNYPITSADFTFNAVKNDSIPERQIFVIVVGETSRAENWSLYGYERNTNPHLSQDSSVVVIQDVLTQSNTTHKSVPIILSAASAEHYSLLYKQKSIITAFEEVDFTTIFLSNQPANRTFTDYYAQEADIYKYFRFFGDPTNEYDEVLVKEMKHYIDSIPQNQNLFFVLHTYGSHFDYSARYPKEFSTFTPDSYTNISKKSRAEMLNAYDNTILYTDYILSSIISVLKDTNASSALIYCSDHAEDIMDDDRNRFLHASPNPTFYQLRIPFVLWMSDKYKEYNPIKKRNLDKNKDAAISTNVVFHTMLDMANIFTPSLDESKSLVNMYFIETDRMYLDSHYEEVWYQQAGLTKYDKEMIEKRHLKP